MAVADEVQAAGGVPEPIGIDLASGDPTARRAVVPQLNGGLIGDGPRQPIDGVAMLPIPFVRPESDAERAVELLNESYALRR